MIKQRSLFLFLFFSFFTSFSLYSADFQIVKGNWTILFKENDKTLDFINKGKTILSDVSPTVKYNLEGGSEVTLTPASYTSVAIDQEAVADTFGTGTKYTFRYTKSGLPTLRHIFYAYDDLPYFLTEVALDNDVTVYSNYMSPLTTTTSVAFLTQSANNRMILVPWDNDGWVRYESNTLTMSTTSYEATSVYNGDDRSGLVIGSIEHDTWKSAIEMTGSNNVSIDRLVCYSGITSSYTRDLLAHGKVKGKTIKSAKMFVGFFEDWRAGMEAYGKANTLVVPSRKWSKGTPFGWNSWGVLADKVTYADATSVSDFFADSLYSKGFHNDSNNVIIDLDSYWDNMSTFQLKQFAKNCVANGQIPGIYWCPFSDWGSDGERYVEGTNNLYKYKDCYLYINGEIHSQGGRCMDPTHPATKMRIKAQFDKFKSWGFKYVKLDFITNAAIQGDSYYNPDVTTGTQAYNEGFKYLTEEAGDDFFFALSIAPIFPYQYGNSRRMCCDSWAGIGDSQYVMNALSFGWWTNQFYQYNDPDHLVLVKNGSEAISVNRVRVSTGAISGMVMYGDNFSNKTPVTAGFPTLSRTRAMSLMTNNDINDIARMGRSFKPVQGYIASYNGAENLFMYETDQYFYLACLNYSSRTIFGTIPLERLGLTTGNVGTIKELWIQNEVSLASGGFYYQVPGNDARIYRITKKDYVSGIVTPREDKASKLSLISSNGNQLLQSESPFTGLSIYNLQGQLLVSSAFPATFSREINSSEYQKGLYILRVDMENGPALSKKIVVE